MGFRVLLIAVTGKSADTIHSEYGVIATGGHEEIPESSVTGAQLPSGAYLLYVNDQIVPGEGVLARLSKGASLLACYVNETVMNSALTAWVDGAETWSVTHDGQESAAHLATTGTPPAELNVIREKQAAKQSGVEDVDHTFDVPIDLFVALGGLRYDSDIEEAGPEPWATLTHA